LGKGIIVGEKRMAQTSLIRLGVNIDHVATLRQARRIHYPDPVEAAILAIKAGADGITLHLREDRRHIQEADLWNLKKHIKAPINLEMAVNEEIIRIAEEYKPSHCCLVPEKREELTTEGGLNVLGQEQAVAKACRRLADAGIQVSLFIDPDLQQIQAAERCGAPVVELTTGQYADATNDSMRQTHLDRIKAAAEEASKLGLIVNGGHGLNYDNVAAIAAIPQMHELNIGHSLVSFAVYWGIENAVKKMKELMLRARH
jgi:pyridoxine 5-phosphate synthase